MPRSSNGGMLTRRMRPPFVAVVAVGIAIAAVVAAFVALSIAALQLPPEPAPVQPIRITTATTTVTTTAMTAPDGNDEAPNAVPGPAPLPPVPAGLDGDDG